MFNSGFLKVTAIPIVIRMLQSLCGIPAYFSKAAPSSNLEPRPTSMAVTHNSDSRLHMSMESSVISILLHFLFKPIEG